MLKYILAFAVSAAISLASLIAITWIMNQHSYSMLAVCTMVVILANVLVASQFRYRMGRAVIISILSALILLTTGELLHTDVAMSERILSHFGIAGADGPGAGQDIVTLFINQKGVDLLRRLDALGVKTRFDAAGGHIDNAQILSRLGAEYFLRADGQHFTVPKDDVVSWIRRAPPEAGGGGSHFAHSR